MKPDFFTRCFQFHGAHKTIHIFLRYLSFHFNKKVLGRKTIRRRIHNFTMNLDLQNKGISRNLYLFGTREEDHRVLLAEELGTGGLVLDIGANMGYYVLQEAKLIGSTGRIIAVEPDPRNLELLRGNIADNNIAPRVELMEGAISDRDGTMSFGIHTKSNCNCLLDNVPETSSESFNQIIEVRSFDIKSILASRDRISLIRMDIEGYEVRILGAILAHIRLNPHQAPLKIIFEAHTIKYGQYEQPMSDILAGLCDCGYHVRSISSEDDRDDTIRNSGYRAEIVTRSEFRARGIYRNIRVDDAIRFVCKEGCVRIVVLSHKPRKNE